MKYKDFYSHLIENTFNENVLDEGYFHIPEKIIEKIKEKFVDAYKKYKSKNISKVTSADFPPEIFELDFSGTKFQFLNSLEPKPSVVITYIKNGPSFADIGNTRNNRIPISLALEAGQHGVESVIEHEVLHAVQYLILIYIKEKMIKKHGADGWFQKFREYIKKFKELNPQAIEQDIERLRYSNIGGLPSNKYLPKNIDVHGYIIGSKSGRRVPHSRRPVEYYTDLLTSVRELHGLYYKKYHKSDNWDKLKDSESDKKKFFLDFMKDVNSNDGGDGEQGNKSNTINSGYAVPVFSRFKNISPDFYKKMLAIAYNAFVNNPANFDPERIKKAMQSVSADGEKPGPEKKFKTPVSISNYRSYTECMEVFSKEKTFYDGTLILDFKVKNDDMFDKYLKMAKQNKYVKPKYEKAYWESNYHPTSEVSDIFKKMSELRNEKFIDYVFHVELSGSDGSGTQPYQKISKNIPDIQKYLKFDLPEKMCDAFATRLARMYINSAIKSYVPELKQEINSAYGKPIV